MSADIALEIHRQQERELVRQLALRESAHRCPGCIVRTRASARRIVGRLVRRRGAGRPPACCPA